MRRPAILLACLLASCEAPPPVTTSSPRIVICATVYPLAEIARVVGGEQLKADWILDLGDPTAGFSLTAAERDRLRSVDFVFCDGLRTEAWAAEEITAMQQTENLVALESLPAAVTAPSTGYLWLDPVVVREFIPRLSAALGRRMPKHKEDFEQRGTALVAQLDAVMAKHPREAFGNAKVMTVSSQFDTLLARCGIKPTLIDANPLRITDDEIYRLRTISRDQGLTALLLPFDTPPGTVVDIEARTGMRAILIDHLGLTNYPGHQSFIEILDYNLTQLRAAATITPAQG